MNQTKKANQVSYHNSTFFEYALTGNDESSHTLARSIIETLTNRKVNQLTISNMKYTKDEEDNDYVEVEDEHGYLYYLKMVMSDFTKEEWCMTQHHAARMITRQVDDEEYLDNIKPVCEIIFINGKAKDFDDDFIHRLQMRHAETNEPLEKNPTMQYIIVYLPYIDQLKKTIGFQNMSEFEHLCYLFRNGEQDYVNQLK